MAALAPVARALPKAQGTVILAPIEFTTFAIVESVTFKQLTPQHTQKRWTYAAMWALKPFPRGFDVERLTPVWVDAEFTERERPGTGGGIQGQVPDVYRFWQMEPRIWTIEIGLAQYGNRVPEERPLWIHAEGVTWR